MLPLEFPSDLSPSIIMQSFSPDETYKDINFVRKETEQLAEQLRRLA